MRKLILSLSFLSLFLSGAALACSGAGASKHIGLVTKVTGQSFTIKDAESQSPITFRASKEILKSLKDFKGRVLVSYEEDVGGDLTAIGVTF